MLQLTFLSAQAARLGFSPRLIVLDTLARTILGLDELSSRDMGIFVRNAERIGERLGALVMPVHHTGKDEGRGMRGSSALNGAADAQWQLRRDARGILFNVEKMKDGPSGFDVRFDLEEVEVGTDADGDAVTTRVVGFPEQPVVVAAAAPQAKPGRTLKRHDTLGMFAAALAACGGDRPGSGRGPRRRRRRGPVGCRPRGGRGAAQGRRGHRGPSAGLGQPGLQGAPGGGRPLA